jgi:hypothetical protein
MCVARSHVFLKFDVFTAVTMKKAEWRYVHPKRRFLQEPNSVTSQRTALALSLEKTMFRRLDSVGFFKWNLFICSQEIDRRQRLALLDRTECISPENWDQVQFPKRRVLLKYKIKIMSEIVLLILIYHPHKSMDQVILSHILFLLLHALTYLAIIRLK